MQWYKYFHEVDIFNGKFIFHQMKIFLLLHEWKHSLFVLYDTKILKIDKFYQILKWIKYKTNIHTLFENN
jgi:hypothetical protein